MSNAIAGPWKCDACGHTSREGIDWLLHVTPENELLGVRCPPCASLHGFPAGARVLVLEREPREGAQRETLRRPPPSQSNGKAPRGRVTGREVLETLAGWLAGFARR
jgi:hypothetical protein